MSKEKKWRIDDTLFYPLGIVNNSSASKEKTVFVTWTYDYLMSFVFKKDEDNSTILKDVIRIPVDNLITNILVLCTNTIVLMDNGNVYYFSSPKHLKKIHSLNDIQCINASKNGFCVIRILKNYKINLEVHNDLEQSNEIGSNFQKYDITFDEENLFNSSWKSEQFTITSVIITKLNASFLKLLTKCDLGTISEVYFFSINNYLFCLCPEEDKTDYYITQLATYASEIEMIQIVTKSNMFLVFLSCGVIEILFESKLSKMIDKIAHCVGNEFIDRTFSNDSFFYSDGNKIYKINFDYDDLLHTCTVHTISNNVRGIVAITWVESIKKIVCLSENNIFYRCKFKNSDYNKTNQNEDNSFFELTDKKVRELKEKTELLKKLQEKPVQIKKQIENEFLKQDIISAYKNTNSYAKHILATLRLHTEPYSADYYLVLTINCTKIEIFQNINWKLVLDIKHGTHSKLKILPIHKDDFLMPFQIPLSFRKEDLVMLPELKINLITFINVASDFVCISIPISIDHFKLNDAFSENQNIPQIRNENFNKSVQYLAPFSNHFVTSNDKDLEFCVQLKTPTMFGSRHLTNIFGLKSRTDVNDIILYFIGKPFTLQSQFNESENYICLKCNDPVVLFYAKTIITTEICSDSYNSFLEVDPKQSKNELQRLKAQLSSFDVNNMELNNIYNMKQRLIQLYEKVRGQLKEF